MSQYSPTVHATWGQSLADALGQGVNSYLQSRRQKTQDDRIAQQEKTAADERAYQHSRDVKTDALALALHDASMRNKGYVPDAERGTDSREVVGGGALDSAVGAVSGPMLAGALGHPGVTASRYSPSVGGYSYDAASPSAENERLALALRQSEVAKNNAQAARDAQPQPHAPVMGSDAWRDAQRFSAGLGSLSHQQNRDYDVNHPMPQQESTKPTEFSNKAALVYPRAQQAAGLLEPAFKSGMPAHSWVNRIPGLGNYGVTDAERSTIQAAETVSSAILRLESGAAISEHEVKEYAKQFLPQPGDDANTRAQKRATLQLQLERMKAAAGPTMNHEQPANPYRR